MDRQNTAFLIEDMRFTYPGAKSSENDTLQIPFLEISKGEVTVLRGHNGSGKTTLMKLLGGLLSPDGGRIVRSGDLRSVLVQQEPYLFHGTVFHNLNAPLRFLGRKPVNRESLVRDTLARVGLQGFEKRKARELSGGEKKRAAIARALISNPEVLFLDEPDANVDEETSRLLISLILKLKKEGTTVILCSHSRSFAYRTADRIIDLKQGKRVESHENLFKGSCSRKSNNRFISGEGEFYCYTGEGDHNTMVIPPESISLSRSELSPKEGNRLEGILKSLTPVEDDGIMASLECGTYTIKVRLNRSEAALQEYKQGEKLHLYFSAASVKLY